MKEMEKVLRQHAARYPAMEPTDAVKLIYQNEFGGGHMVRDPEAFLAFLRREYSEVEKIPDAPAYEQIGNGIVRVYLSSLSPEEVETLGKAFLKSASAHRGTLESFRKKLDVLRRLTAEGVFGFDAVELQMYLAEYESAGYPAVSHSPRYREAYHPAYRIIPEKYSFR